MSARRLLRSSLLAALAALVFAPAAAADPDRGEKLFRLCKQCHGSVGEGNALALSPAIAGLDEWYVTAQLKKFKAGVRGTHPKDIGGLRMHPMSLSLRTDEDIQAVAGYVAGLPPVPPQPVLEGGDSTRGAALYAVCGACHGPDGAGNQAMNAPQLRGASDWYLLSSLQKYKAGVRGWNPENVNAALMRGMAAQLADEQAMKDVIAYIGTFSASK